jgi:hypothetical protein
MIQEPINVTQNVSSFFLSAAISSPEQFWLLTCATAGGVFVLVGLVLERFAEWLDDSFLGGWKAHKSMEKCGWRILMLGIAIEIVDAGYAANEGWQTSQIAIKNDPRNANISYMYATAILRVKGMQFNDMTNWNPNHVALIRLCQNDVKNIPFFDWLEAETYKRSDFHNLFDSVNREYAIRFQSWGFLPGSGFEKKVKNLDDVNLLQMEINFLPRGSEISGGGVELIANNLHKVFAILPQTDTNVPDGAPGFPYIVLATNWDKEMK